MHILLNKRDVKEMHKQESNGKNSGLKTQYGNFTTIDINTPYREPWYLAAIVYENPHLSNDSREESKGRESKIYQ
jgi:hypothetical protein